MALNLGSAWLPNISKSRVWSHNYKHARYFCCCILFIQFLLPERLVSCTSPKNRKPQLLTRNYYSPLTIRLYRLFTVSVLSHCQWLWDQLVLQAVYNELNLHMRQFLSMNISCRLCIIYTRGNLFRSAG